MWEQESYDSASYEKGKLAARSDAPVLIVGETGVGKEVLARSIHLHSVRRNMTFVPVSCASIASTLFESELFGHTKGAFTGATESKKGFIEIANCGTLFLDEISEVPSGMQTKLLRVIETKEYYQVGSTAAKTADFRLISASNRSFAELNNGQFLRKDFLYRINTFVIEMPPLRQRRDAIPDLLSHFLSLRGSPAKFSGKAIELILCYPFPGNIRELRNMVDYAVASAGEKASLIDAGHLPRSLLDYCGMITCRDASNLRETLACFAATYVRYVLNENGGDVDKVAEQLGVSRATVYRAIRRSKG